VVGAVGVVAPWGMGMAAVVLVPNALDASGLFIWAGASFQSWPAMPFILVGSVMVVLGLLGGGPARKKAVLPVVGIWAGLLAAIGLLVLPDIPQNWITVEAPAAAVLARVESMVPARAEVISSGGVVGRFGTRDSVYELPTVRQKVPVDEKEVVFVLLPVMGADDALPDRASANAVRYVRSRLDARVLEAESGVYAFAWSPPAGTTSVSLP
jgi:hypothetical protein